MVSRRICSPAVVAVVVFLVAVARAEGPAPELKPVDTGLGFSIGVPSTWVVGTPSGRSRFVAGSKADDFSVIVTDFGPLPSDPVEAEKIYRGSFDRYGFTMVTTADEVVAGMSVKRYVFAMKADAGPGHVEVVMLPVAGNMYAVMLATPATSAEARRPLIGSIFKSITLGGSR
jgi:hypothetical protein